MEWRECFTFLGSGEAVCRICGYTIYERDFVRSPVSPRWVAEDHARMHSGPTRESLEALNRAMRMDFPGPAVVWAPPDDAPELPKLHKRDAGKAVAEAEAILTLALPLTYHLRSGCHCGPCMTTFMESYDGFEAVFEEGEVPCPVDESAHE